ncbi:MAG: mechanosensitive ion channel family protein, partial [Nitrospirae bacterium]
RLADLVWLDLALTRALAALSAPEPLLACLGDATALAALLALPLLWWRRPPVVRATPWLATAFGALLAAAAALLLLALAGYHNLATALASWGAGAAGLATLWWVATRVAADLWRLALRPQGRLARLASLQEAEAVRLARTLARLTSAAVALALLLWQDPTRALFASPLGRLLWAGLHHPLARIGSATVTPVSLLQGALVFAAFLFASRLLRRLLRDRVYPRTHLDAGVRNAINNFINYGLLTLGVLVALQAVGIELTTLTVFAGALGVGLGFGLQNIANNFVSGLILLMERPVKTGDYVDLGETRGVVERIGARSTVIRTRDNIAIVVPNSELISRPVTNWSLSDPKTRIHVAVGVAYGTDPRRVEALLLQVARDHPQVLEQPPPKVWFHDFGDSALEFVLLCWVRNPATTGLRGLRSQLRFAITDRFAEAGIEIPFPQRDLHLRSVDPEAARALGPLPATGRRAP